MRVKSVNSVLLSILLVTSLIASASIAILTSVSPPVSAAGNSIENCVPDLGQHDKNWCWVASAANSMYWLSQHGYPQLIDNYAAPPDNDNVYIKTMILTPPPPVPPDNVYDLLQEIASACLFPGVPGKTIADTWDTGIFNGPYFFGLQYFINQQVAALTVHEIVDPGLANIPPQSDNVIYATPTLDNYENKILENSAVLLWLASNGRNENTQDYPLRYEDTDHVVTGVGYYDGGAGNQWILVSDPWTTGNPDHGNDLHHATENHPYDNLVVAISAPLTVIYPKGSGNPVQVKALIYISPTVPPTPPAPVDNYKIENMPDLGQHCENWCWTAAAANIFKWYYHNGYPKLMDDPNSPGLDNSYLQWEPTPPPLNKDPLGDNVMRLLHEIAKDCLYPNVTKENLENENLLVPWPITFCNPIDDNRFFYGLQKFIREQGGQFKVREILDNNYFRGVHQSLPPENIPPENDNIVIYEQPTFDNYKNLLKSGGVLLQLDFRNYNYETGNLEGLDHIVTGVSYYDGGQGNQWMLVSDSWTPLPGPDHNDNEDLHTYDNLLVMSTDPLIVVYTGYTQEGAQPTPVQVVKLISITPTASWTGTATFALENLYKVSLNKNLQLNTGSKLIVKFYDYSDTYESENILENNFALPLSIVDNENVPHPAQGSLPVRTAVKKASLVLTTDNENQVISTIASFTVHQSDLRTRNIAILRLWASHPELQSAFRAEVIDILRQWSGAPS